MNFDEFISFCNPVEVKGPEPDQLGELTQNSTEVTEHDIFIALKGLRTDGHKYINGAVSAGAGVIICEQFPEEMDAKDACFVKVKNTRNLIGPLSQKLAGNPAEALSIIGITGTNGKTTVATLIYQILSSMGVATSLLGTVHSRILEQKISARLTTTGAVELARNMKKMVNAGSTHLVMEVSSHALHQKRVDGITFDGAAFTNLSHDHLDYHGSMEAYSGAKKRLFDQLEEDTFAVINSDDKYGKLIMRDTRAKVTRFGFTNSDADIACQIVAMTTDGTTVKIGEKHIQTPLVGRFNAYNVAQAFLICQNMGFPETDIITALKEARGAEGRLERVEAAGKNPLVLVDYAHTPDALKNVLETLNDLKTKGQKLHLVFGAGGNRDRTKRPEMAAIAESLADVITVTSDNPRYEDPDAIIRDIADGFSETASYKLVTDRKEAIQKTIKQASARDMVLIAGKGHETYQEIKGVRSAFDDRIVARKALVQRNNQQSESETGEVA